MERETDSSLENQQEESECGGKKKRWVHYGDPDYYESLPPQLQYLSKLPFADGSFDFYPPAYEIEVDDSSGAGTRAFDASWSKNQSSEG